MSLASLLILFLNGLTNGMLLFLISVGLSLIFGVMNILNFAHGSFYMLGVYLTFFVVVQLQFPFIISLIIAPIIVAIIGGVIEIVLLRKIYHKDTSFQLLLTFTLVLIINDLVRLFWGSAPLTVDVPKFLNNSITLWEGTYPTYNLFIITISPIIGLLLWLLLTQTRFGKIIRAASQDPTMTGLLGINVPQLFTFVFMIGVWLSGIAGVLASPLRTVNPAIAEQVIIDSFMVVVIGGLDSLIGSLITALIIGQMNAFGILIFPQAQIAFPFILMALVLLFRPQGLFTKKS